MELRIQKFERKDWEPLYELLSDGEVMRYLEPPYTLQQTEKFLGTACLSTEPLIYAVDDGNGRFIGYVIYHDYGTDGKEIGWVLKPDAWGKGYAKELTKKLIEKAQSEGKSVVIECAPEQSVTKHIAEKFGFLYTGRYDGCDVYRLEENRAGA